MSLTNIAAILWIALGGYAFSVFQSWKNTNDYVKEKFEQLLEEEAEQSDAHAPH